MNILFNPYFIKSSAPVSRLDYSHDIDSILFKVYDNIYLNDRFVMDIAGLLKDLYDNNEFVIFKLYFVDIGSHNVRVELPKFSEHFYRYPSQYIQDNIVRFYKNTGVVGVFEVLVWLSLCDNKNLENISKGFFTCINSNIKFINDNIHKDFGNTIINYKNPITRVNDLPLSLFINIDRSNDHMINSKKKDFYNKIK